MPMMVLFAAAAALSATPAPMRPPPAIAQATATIRIVSAVTLKLDGSANAGLPLPRVSNVKAVDGSSHPAKLIEFQ